MYCRICGNGSGNYHTAREMMFGTREEFSYFECLSCGCIQIEQFPADMSKYYDKSYYSFEELTFRRGNIFASWLRQAWVEHCIGGKSHLGKILGWRRSVPELYSIFRKHGITRMSRILDVGCGNGRFLGSLYRAGFCDLTGLDPFIEYSIMPAKEISLKKQDIFAESGKFDYISFNHSLEHLSEQKNVLLKAHDLLADRGIISIAIPIVGYAWRKYGVNWVQLDAPRHFYIHSMRSLAILADQAGLTIVETSYNSDDFQFWGSEQYLKDLYLTAPTSHWINKGKSLFTTDQIAAYRKQAKYLNASSDGDQAIFILRHAL